MGDTICNGDTAMVSADADYAYWYDAATGGNLVGEGDELDVSPSMTTSYYAESAVVKGHSEDFESFTSGGFIVASDPNNWALWPGGTSAIDMPITDAQGNGGTGPTTEDSRYVTEDVPYGLQLTSLLGRLAGRPAKLHEAGIEIFSAMYDRDFAKENKLLAVLELEKYALQDLSLIHI